MQRLVLLMVLLSVLGGCMALPAPVQMASFALDGISLITTEKSLSDHGLSLFTGRDCAFWRGLTEGRFCAEQEDGDDAFTLSEAPGPPGVIDMEVAMAEPAGQGFELPPGMTRPILVTPHR